MKKHLIWQNYDIDIKNYDGCTDNWDEMEDDDKQEYASELNSMYLDDERINLNIELDNSILVIADLGLWNGRKQGYRIIGSNIKDILEFNRSCDYAEWYSDGYNIKGKQSHHDGTNYFEYREIRTNRNIDNLTEKIYNGDEISRKTLNYYTKSIAPKVAKLYGWKIMGRKSKIA
jgi:hypothetical protein